MDPSLGGKGEVYDRFAGPRDPPLNLRARGEVCICKFGDYIVVKIVVNLRGTFYRELWMYLRNLSVWNVYD